MLNQLVRYAPVADLVRELGEGSLLDVGSGSVGIARWLGPEWRVTAIDRTFDDYGTATGPATLPGTVEHVQADARELPFGDRSFDVVLSLDMLEHIDPADRTVVLHQLARVTRRRLIVACPSGSAALDSDRRLDAYYRSRGQEPPGWIGEHLENGFPEPEELRGALAPFGDVRLIGNEAVAAHGRLMRLEAQPRLELLTSAMLRVLRPAASGGALAAPAKVALGALRGRDLPPTYRTFAVVDRRDD